MEGHTKRFIFHISLLLCVLSINVFLVSQLNYNMPKKKNALLIENSARNTDDSESKLNMICL